MATDHILYLPPVDILHKYQIKHAYERWMHYFPDCRYSQTEWSHARKDIIYTYCLGYKASLTRHTTTHEPSNH